MANVDPADALLDREIELLAAGSADPSQDAEDYEQVDGEHCYAMSELVDAADTIRLLLDEAQDELRGWDIDTALLSLDQIDILVDHARTLIDAIGKDVEDA